MSHHIYTTEGLVLRLRPYGESDKIAFIFTHDLGFIAALARGLRKESSRLRTNLIPQAKVRVSVVKGRGSWRVTTATLIEDYMAKLKTNSEAKRALHRVSALVSSLLHGEEKNLKLYKELEESIELLLKVENIQDWELWSVIRILAPLGYLAENEVPKNIAEVTKSRRYYLAMVNERLHISGLYKV